MKWISNRRQQGLSLVELMIAMLLGLLLVAATSQVFLSGSKTYSTVGAVTSLQDSARYALHILSRELRMASYTGCVSRGGSTPLTNTLNNASTVLYNFNNGLWGKDDISGLPSELSTVMGGDPEPLSDTDLLLIRGATDSPVKVSQANDSSRVFLELESNESDSCGTGVDRINGLCPGDLAMISDCAKARIFQVGTITVSDQDPNELIVTHPTGGSPGNSMSNWPNTFAADFKPPSQLVRVSTLVYYIADNPDSGVPALYRKDGNGAAVLIVDGVQDMQITYGIDNDGNFDADDYVDAGNVTDWGDVLAVRIQLHLISLEDNVIDGAQTFTFNGESITATDKRLHVALSHTIALRNRVP